MDADPELAESIRGELRRQQDGVELIASGNIVYRLALEAQGPVLTNKTVEGLPYGRYYDGAEFADAIKPLAIERACQVFGRRVANAAMPATDRERTPTCGAQVELKKLPVTYTPGVPMSKHKATIKWVRNGADFSYKNYSRDHIWGFENGVETPSSVAPAYLGSPQRVDPEAAFVAALSSRHMLTFLALASNKGFIVDSYKDDAVGRLEKNASGKLAITRVESRPRIRYGGDKQPTQADIDWLHDKAHRECFIANSVTTEVRVIPTELWDQALHFKEQRGAPRRRLLSRLSWPYRRQIFNFPPRMAEPIHWMI